MRYSERHLRKLCILGVLPHNRHLDEETFLSPIRISNLLCALPTSLSHIYECCLCFLMYFLIFRLCYPRFVVNRRHHSGAHHTRHSEGSMEFPHNITLYSLSFRMVAFQVSIDSGVQLACFDAILSARHLRVSLEWLRLYSRVHAVFSATPSLGRLR